MDSYIDVGYIRDIDEGCVGHINVGCPRDIFRDIN